MKNLTKLILKVLPTACLIILMAILAVDSKIYVQTTFFGLKLWATSVMPSLLPFFFLTALFTATGTVSRLSKKITPVTRFLYGSDGICAYVQIMSFLSGYPIGAKILCDLYRSGVIDKKQAEKYCTFTSTSSPMFIIGGVGVAMFSSAKTGALIFISHISGSILTGILFRKLPDNRHIEGLFNKNTTDNVLYDAMYGSVVSVLLVGGFIAVFYTLSAVLDNLGVFNLLSPVLTPFLGDELSKAALFGIVECTGGCRLLAQAKLPLSAPLASAVISLGGVSVWCQSLIYLKTAQVRMGIFVFAKLIHAAMAFFICILLQALV